MQINSLSNTVAQAGFRRPRFSSLKEELALKTLAKNLGVEDGYTDMSGRWQTSAPENVRLVVEKLLGKSLDNPIMALKEHLKADFSRGLPPVLVVKQSDIQTKRYQLPFFVPEPYDETQPIKLAVAYESSKQVPEVFELTLKNQIPQQERMVFDQPYSQYLLDLPEKLQKEIPLGYHDLKLTLANGKAIESRLIVVPDKAYQPSWLKQGQKTWGPAVQVYALKHQNDWGIGDFTGLNKLAQWAKKVGAGFIGLSPLHAKNFENPESACPYVPISRQFLNPMLLDVGQVVGYKDWFKGLSERQQQTHQKRLTQLQDKPEVDYTGVYRAKRDVLEKLYEQFVEKELKAITPVAQNFQAYKTEMGDSLKQFATFQALQNKFEAKGWMDWPKPFQNPNSDVVKQFQQQEADKIDFYAFLQWQAEEQLKKVAGTKQDKDLPLGLYQDLAIGSDTAGFESWQQPELYPSGIKMGMPPDPLAPQGQKWAFTPPSPSLLKQKAYKPFVDVLRANMKHARAIRMDHFHGMSRYFWIPDQKTPQDAIYVKNPIQDLLGVLALESHRNKCVVIGEDLGIAPQGFEQATKPWDIFAYKVARWERHYQDEKNGKPFKAPIEYEPNAIAMHSTQDTSTLRGMFSGWFWQKLKDFGLMTETEVQSNQAQDRQALGMTVERLKADGLLHKQESTKAITDKALKAVTNDDDPYFKTLTQAMHGFLAKTSSKLAAFLFEDVIGQEQQVNIPGIADGPHLNTDPKNRQFPNWRKKIAIPLESLLEHPWLDAVVKVFQKERPSVKQA